jgi:hypothetical protein
MAFARSVLLIFPTYLVDILLQLFTCLNTLFHIPGKNIITYISSHIGFVSSVYDALVRVIFGWRVGKKRKGEQGSFALRVLFNYQNVYLFSSFYRKQ